MFQKRLKSGFALVVATLMVCASPTVFAKMKYDGTFKLRSDWSNPRCTRQNITFKVKNHRFSFRDGGNYRWAGRLNSKGVFRITSRPAGNVIRGGSKVPTRTGVRNAIYGRLTWSVCGKGDIRVHKVR